MLVLFVFTGIKGNRWAIDSGKFSDIDEFKQTQKLWAKISAGVLLFILVIILMITAFCYGKMYDKKMGYINEYRTQCTVLNEVLPPIFANIKDNNNVTSLIEELEKNPRVKHKISRPYYESSTGYYTLFIYIDTNTDSKYVTGKTLIYNKDENCNLKNNNCYIELEKRPKKYLEKFGFP